MKSILTSEYGEITNVFWINDKFIIFSDYYREKSFRIIITNFLDNKEEYIDSNKLSIIHGVNIFQKINSDNFYVNCLDQNIKYFFIKNNINITLPPTNFRKLQFSHIGIYTKIEEEDFFKFRIIDSWFKSNKYITYSVRRTQKGISENETKLSIFDNKGNYEKDIHLNNSKNQIKKNIQVFYHYFCNGNIFVGIEKEKICIVNLQTSMINVHSLQENWRPYDLDKEDRMLLVNQKELMIAKWSSSESRLKIFRYKFKGKIKFAKFVGKKVVLAFSRIIVLFPKDDFTQKKEYGCQKMFIKNIFNINKDSFITLFHTFEKQKYEPKIKIYKK
jgi:hypothetical protein